MTPERRSYRRHRFPAEIISHAVWLYHVFSLSLRDVELILAERGIVVTHESIRHWCLKFGADFARRLRRRRPQPGDTWHLDEVARRSPSRRTIPDATRSSANWSPRPSMRSSSGAAIARSARSACIFRAPASWLPQPHSKPGKRSFSPGVGAMGHVSVIALPSYSARWSPR